VASPFTSRTLAFLRALKRNNDREWFRARKDRYETEVRAPMLEVLARLADDLPAFAPDLVADPKVSLYRIYRDTRFSGNKAPLKTHVAAVLPPRGFAKHEAAGLYFEIAPQHVWIGGGLYMPTGPDLHALREHIAGDPAKLDRIVTAAAFRRTVGALEGERLTRVPRGWAKDHPAAHYLRFKQFLAFREFPAELAVGPRFYPTLVRTFRAIAPLVAYLNAPLRAARARTWDPLASPR